MKLTRNERRTLHLLIENGRASDAEIARDMKITPQAVGKIRKKLESEGVIRGYSTSVDYEKLGIKVLAIAMFHFTAEARKTLLTEADITERIKGEHIINFYRIPEGEVTHIVIYGFHQFQDRSTPFTFFLAAAAFQSFTCADSDDGYFITREVILGEKFSEFHLDELQQFFIFHQVDFIEGHDNVWHIYLAC